MAATPQSIAARPASASGLRERNKADKLQRIRAAARALFTEKGYDETTVREIARAADVGLGTLFAYAANKRDLLFLIFNDELDAVTRAMFHDPPDHMSFLDQLVAGFRENYVFFGRQPALSRFMLRELAYFGTGPATRQFDALRRRCQDDIEQLVIRAKARGRLRTQALPQQIGRLVFSLYAIELRRWLREDEPNVVVGIRALRQLLGLLIQGLEPGPGAL
jgi:AcrR family transcriptional regulator